MSSSFFHCNVTVLAERSRFTRLPPSAADVFSSPRCSSSVICIMYVHVVAFTQARLCIHHGSAAVLGLSQTYHRSGTPCLSQALIYAHAIDGYRSSFKGGTFADNRRNAPRRRLDRASAKQPSCSCGSPVTSTETPALSSEMPLTHTAFGCDLLTIQLFHNISL